MSLKEMDDKQKQDLIKNPIYDGQYFQLIAELKRFYFESIFKPTGEK